MVSQHLAVLKKRGIVTSQVQGNKRVYSIANPFIRGLINDLHDTVEETRGQRRKG